MHIAVCMDVAADRKQLERLLGRSADRRLEADPSEPYYVQSYGNKEALLARPFMYDLFFIELCSSDIDSVSLIKELRNLGVTATIAYCPSKVDLSMNLEEGDNVLILHQPVKESELEDILDEGLKCASAREPKLDIRSMEETVLVCPDEFMYAKKDGDMIEVLLKNGEIYRCSETINKFYRRCAKFKDIFLLSGDLVAHRQAVRSGGFRHVILCDGTKARVSGKSIKEMDRVK